jgi:hypothetical protein
VGGEVREGGVAFRVGHFIVLRGGERERGSDLGLWLWLWLGLDWVIGRDFWIGLDWIGLSCRAVSCCIVP